MTSETTTITKHPVLSVAKLENVLTEWDTLEPLSSLIGLKTIGAMSSSNVDHFIALIYESARLLIKNKAD